MYRKRAIISSLSYLEYKMTVTKILLATLLIIVVFVFSPFVTIWSLNTLFATKIAYTFDTWSAMVWLTVVTFGRISMKKNEE